MLYSTALCFLFISNQSLPKVGITLLIKDSRQKIQVAKKVILKVSKNMVKKVIKKPPYIWSSSSKYFAWDAWGLEAALHRRMMDLQEGHQTKMTEFWNVLYVSVPEG